MSARRRRAARALLVTAALLAGTSVVLPLLPQGQAVGNDDTSVTRTVTATRVFIDEDGTRTEASSNRITLRVSQTENLRGRQEVKVSWEGAIPTGGVVGDPTLSDARNQEFPLVLLQCRGIDTDGPVARGQVRLSPETCWTQTSTERYLAAASHTPSWRFDAFAEPADREAVVGRPEKLPAACEAVSEPLSARWLSFRALSGAVYHGGPDPSVGCTPLAPESDNAEAGGLPSNTTYGITGPDGRGEADFAVWTASENASLGCSPSVQCSLVAVPIVGLSCDAWGNELPGDAVQTTKAGTPLSASQLSSADATCRSTGAYEPGAPRSSETTDQAVRGNLWWSASNWRNRISVPLEFAVSGSICDAVSDEAPLEIMGSILLNELTGSWRPEFCTTEDLFPFTHVQQSDSLARQLVEVGEIKAAFTTAAPADGFQRPVVAAPVAFGGFAIAFTIDDADQQRREELKLNARLVAKLLSSSYPGQAMVRDNHPSIGGNPLNITLDPEFQALNPGIPQVSLLESAAALQLFSSSSDLIGSLTQWIGSDPAARAWLDGQPDPWGMTVNDSYEGIALPVDSWPLLDPFLAPQFYIDQNACYANSPTPFMQLISNPVSNISTVLLNMQFGISSAATVCRYDGTDATTLPLRQQGRQQVGYRFVMGLVSLSAAERYNLRTAALQTGAPGDGSFVAPSTESLRAAAGLLEADEEAGLWTLDHARLSTPAGAKAYPGAMPVYAVIPTSGLEAADAVKFGRLLCYSAGPGQVTGAANGQLPAGYLPVTEANDLGAQQGYTRAAALAVRAQAGTAPALDAKAPSLEEACDFSVEPEVPVDDGDGAGGGTGGGGAGVVPPALPDAVPAVDDPAPRGEDAPAAPVTEAVTALTAGQTSAWGDLGLPGMLLLALACALGGSLMRWWEQVLALRTAAGPRLRALPGSARQAAGRRRKES